jgi:hypothetical protein
LGGTFSIPRTLAQTHNPQLIPCLIHSFTHTTFAATASVSSTFVPRLQKQQNLAILLHMKNTCSRRDKLWLSKLWLSNSTRQISIVLTVGIPKWSLSIILTFDSPKWSLDEL